MRRLVLAFAILLVSGCHPSVSGDGGGGGGSSATGGASGCGDAGDCADGEVCAFDVKDACSARGACVPKPKPANCIAIAILTACDCDGNDIKWEGGCSPDLPSGFAPAPISHYGSCDSQPDCVVDTDCVPANGYTPPDGFTHGTCAYPRRDGCAAAASASIRFRCATAWWPSPDAPATAPRSI